jgi:hypothetical protein
MRDKVLIRHVLPKPCVFVPEREGGLGIKTWDKQLGHGISPQGWVTIIENGFGTEEMHIGTLGKLISTDELELVSEQERDACYVRVYRPTGRKPLSRRKRRKVSSTQGRGNV